MSQILISAPSTTPVRATSPPLQIVIHKGTACLSLQPRSLNVGLILRTDANEYSSSDSQIQFGLMSAIAVRKRNVIFVEYRVRPWIAVLIERNRKLDFRAWVIWCSGITLYQNILDLIASLIYIFYLMVNNSWCLILNPPWAAVSTNQWAQLVWLRGKEEGYGEIWETEIHDLGYWLPV